MIGCLRTHVCKQPITALYFETVLKFYNLWPYDHDRCLHFLCRLLLKKNFASYSPLTLMWKVTSWSFRSGYVLIGLLLEPVLFLILLLSWWASWQINRDYYLLVSLSCADPEGGGGKAVRTPLKNHENIGFLSNTGPDPLKNHKATKPAFNVGPSSVSQRNTIYMAFCWQADGGPFIAVFGSSIPSSTKKKNVIKYGPPLTKLSGCAHDFWSPRCFNTK